jgi:uncharacterized protein
MNDNPLNNAELAFIDEMLLKYGNDEGVLDSSELDGFLTAIVSGPTPIMPSQWFPALWGGEGNEPEWESEAELRRFTGLVIQHMNNVITLLMEQPQNFQALFGHSVDNGNSVAIAEEWCFGYMRGIGLAPWPALPPTLAAQLALIALHGTEAGFDTLEAMTPEQHQQSVALIEPAARALHAYWLSQRSADDAPARATPLLRGAKTGRNDPCPCGSGKKFKQCCLH